MGSPKTLLQMQKLEQELNDELLWLGDCGTRLKTEPSTTASYNSRKVVQMKPTMKGFKMCEVKLAEERQRNASKIMGKENKPANVVKQRNSLYAGVAKPKPPQIKQKQAEKKMPQPRLLIEEYQSDGLFDDHQESYKDSSPLFPDDTLKLDGDSIDFEIRETNHTERAFDSNHMLSLKDCMKSMHLKQGRSTHMTSKQLECTFKPNILQKSKKMAERLEPSFDRLTSRSRKNSTIGYQQVNRSTKKISQERLQNLSKPRQPKVEESREQEEHSFRPILSKKSLKNYQYTDLDIVARNQLWLREKQNKIQKLREEQRSRQERESLSKRKSISPVKMRAQKQVTMSKFMKDGINGHFERIQQASNLKKQSQQAELRYSGKGWNRSITKPKQFKLSGAEKDRSKMNNCAQKNMQKQYQRAVKELHQKIKKLNI